MALGCSIIAARNGPFPEVLKDFAIYYPPRDINKLSEIIIMNSKKKKELNNLKNKSSNILKYYSWENAAQETLEILT